MITAITIKPERQAFQCDSSYFCINRDGKSTINCESRRFSSDEDKAALTMEVVIHDATLKILKDRRQWPS